ncbi:MAG: methylmalonyl Co-A mutase-associated GTPase MeaB [Candidatus Limnocylindrales bacterium]
MADTRAPASDDSATIARAADLCDAALAGDRRSLARLLTAVENRSPLAEAALRRLYPISGRAQLVGVTGPPGAGKSTLVAALIAELRRANRPVAVVAVDPSSPITGGAVLGDRVRMQAYSSDDGVFIRSMAARGHSGGLSSATAAAATVFDAVGFDVVLIETVGTGQSEVEVAATADTTVVVEAPEMGDEIQAIKAGLLEVADIVVVNKGDRPGAHRTAGQLRAMLADGPGEARPGHPARRDPEVLVTTAATGEGVAELLAAIDRHRASARDSLGSEARLKRAEAQVWAVLVDRLHQRVRWLEGAPDGATGESVTAPGSSGGSLAAGELLRAVASHELDPFAAADALLELLTASAVGTGGIRREDSRED